MANIADDAVGGLNAGVGLAQHIQNVQAQRTALEEQKKQLYVKKIDFIADKLKTGLLLPDKAKDSYFKTVQLQAEHLGIPFDPASVQVMRDPDYRKESLSALNHILQLPDDQKAQAGEQTLAFLGGDVSGLSKFLLNVKEAQSKASLAQSAMGLKTANLTNRQDSFAERQFNSDKTLTANQQRLDGVGRINDLLDSAKQGQIVTNEQIRNLIGEEVARLELGTGSLGLGQSERNTLIGTFKSQTAHLTERLTGNPKDAITPGQLGQLTGQLKVMTDSYAKQTDARIAILASSRVPEVRATVLAKADELRKQYADRLGGWNGLVNVAKPGSAAQDGLTQAERDALTSRFKLQPGTAEYAQKVQAYQAYKAKQGGGQAQPSTGAEPTASAAPAPGASAAPDASGGGLDVSPEPDANALDVQPEPDAGGGQ